MTVPDPITDRVRYYQCLNAIEGYSGWAALGITNVCATVNHTTWTEPSTGGGGNPNPYAPLPNVSLKDDGKAWRWGQGNPPINDCLGYCKKTMDEYEVGYGSSSTIYRLTHEITNQHGGTELLRWGNDPVRNYQNGIDCINNHLNNNRPIIVGIDYGDTKIDSDGHWINEGTTDHFVVVYGRIYNPSTGNYEYLYYENGVNDINKCCSDDNRLIYDPSGLDFYSNYRQLLTPKRYDVTQIRPNDGYPYPNTTVGYLDREE